MAPVLVLGSQYFRPSFRNVSLKFSAFFACSVSYTESSVNHEREGYGVIGQR